MSTARPQYPWITDEEEVLQNRVEKARERIKQACMRLHAAENASSTKAEENYLNAEEELIEALEERCKYFHGTFSSIEARRKAALAQKGRKVESYRVKEKE